jgi:predicted nuclease of predicted toxin-antitoxin system
MRRVLIDQDVYRPTIELLRTAGHDVVCAADIGLSRAPDSEILDTATRLGRILITRDLDFGRLLQDPLLRSAPVVILRCSPATLSSVHRELLRVLDVHAPGELAGAIIVVEPDRHRIRRLAP